MVTIKKPKQPKAAKPPNGSVTTSRGKQRKSGAKQPGKPSMVLAPCTAKYATVLNDPIGAFHAGVSACVPDTMTFPTLKRSFILRGNAYTGTLGMGYVCINPYNPGVEPNVIFTKSTNVITSTGVLSSFTAVSDIGATTLPGTQLATAWTGGDAEYRIVGAGLKVVYSGTLLERGGTVDTLHVPHNDDVAGYYSMNSLAVDPLAVRYPVTGREYYRTWKPEAANDLGFITTAKIPGANNCVIIAMRAPTTTPISFTWEAVFHYELTGFSFRSVGGITPSESDPVGFSAVMNAKNANETREPVNTSSFLKTVTTNLLDAGSFIYDNGPAIRKLIDVGMGAKQVASLMM